MSIKKVLITRKDTLGHVQRPIEYPADKYEARKKFLAVDGWRLATKAEIERWNNITEVVAPKPPVKTDTPKPKDK